MLDRRPDDLESAAETGLRFGLSTAVYKRWWFSWILPEDAQEFVKLHHGTEDGARMVCALDYLTNVAGHTLTPEMVVRSYCYAREYDDEMAGSSAVRYEAQALWDSDAVKMLYAKLHQRSDRAGALRLRRLVQGAAEKNIAAEDLDERKLAIDSSLRLLSLDDKRESREESRRDTRAISNAIRANEARMVDVTRLPSIEEFKSHLLVMREAYGDEAFMAAIEAVLPRALNPSE